MQRPKAALCALALVSALAGRARADASPSSVGTVIAIDSGDLVLDLGSAKHVHDGDLVELWRPVRLRHPVTGQLLVDRFRIGTVRLTQVRSALSLSVIEGAVSRPPAAGDLVIVPERAPATNAPLPVAPAPVLPTALARAPARAPDAAAPVVVTVPQDAAVKRTPVAPPLATAAPKLDRVRLGEPQRFAIELDARFSGGVVHVRRKGAAGYRSLAMESVGPRYWAATLPGDAMTDTGMEYFVEGVPAEGAPVAVVGTADAPRSVEVDPPALYVRTKDAAIAQVSLQSEYASFNAKRANDYVWQTEGSVGWRLRDEGIRAVRSGFGVLRGKGGSLDDLDERGYAPEIVGLTYGYVEAEVTISSSYALIGRPILGLRESGITGGASAFVRVGNDLRTNLLVGGEILGGVGQRGIVELDWKTIARVPIVLRTEVTTQPASSGDVGARVIAQVGYQLVRELTVSARASYQGRTISHAGPGAGLAVGYQW